MKRRANAKVDKFTLSTQLREKDWKFFSFEKDEAFLAWQFESRLQIKGNGSAWLDFSKAQRKQMVTSYCMSRQNIAPAVEVKLPFRQIAKNTNYAVSKEGCLLLTVDINCHRSIDDILAWLKKRIQSDRAFKEAKKRAGGRLNSGSYSIWLYQLAMVRVVHQCGNEKAIKFAKQYWQKNIDAAELQKCRDETVKRLVKKI